MKRLSIGLAVLGLVLDTALVGWFGLKGVVAATLSIGWGGFVLITAWQAALFVLLGAAWNSLLPRGRRSLPTAVAARLVRDAAGSCLPFSQLGAFLLGARAMTLGGVPASLAASTTLVDVTAEFLGLIGFSAIGLIVLLARAPGSALAVPLAIGLAVAVAAGAGFIGVQRGAGRLFRALGRRLRGGWFDGAAARLDAVEAELADLYANGARLALAAVLHLLAWIGTGVGTWIALRLLGVPIDLASALALEALLDGVLSLAFLVPGYAGVQEAGYASLGMVFGVPPEVAIGVSLLRRARDLALGVPVLLVWQAVEAGRLRRPKPRYRRNRPAQ